ncbi:putative ABC transport system permease protein [Tumebacillus sp. BK434]|uniref:ABC transporter permease n=1 Tax=Tumebacillus sp. BK434 TaxID=2512169 RepID=UPI001046B650|nr:ABC transporter permease [Tumebacillus sp. BK434]TCP55922.1 putative ABC transport system permease protein [Tumebacillus sp. BK434]
MNVWESVLLALENVRVNKMRSFLTIIGIVVGVAAVIAVVSIGQAGKSSLVSELGQVADGSFIVIPQSQGETGGVTVDDVEQIKRLKGIDAAIGMLTLPAESKHGKETINFTLNGTNADYIKINNVKITAGHFFTAGEERSRQKVLVVEQKYAEKMYGSAAAALNKKVTLNSSVYRIVGVYKVEESLLAGLAGNVYNALLPLGALPGVGEVRDVQYIQAKAATADQAEVGKQLKEVRKLLAKRHNTAASNYIAQTGEETQQAVASAFNVVQTIIGSIAGISLLVGGIGVMNIMLVSVTERTREIGIRKAIGATPGMIMRQFLVEAVILCFLGGLIGTLIGLLAAGIFSMATGWPFLVSWWTILLAFGFSAAVGIFFGLYPANKAARMQPIESLRYE